jgi:hypothetical protein
MSNINREICAIAGIFGSGRKSVTTTVENKVPEITADIDQAKRDIAEHGVAILSGVLSPDEHALLRDTVYAEAEAALSPLVRHSKQTELLKLLGFDSDSPLGRVYGRPAF